MGTLLRLPVDEAAFDRLVQRERQANMAADRAEAVEDARAVLRSPKRHSERILRDACAVLQAWGDGQDYLTADAMIFALNRRERLRAHNAAMEASVSAASAEETPVRIALRHRAELAAICVGLALAVLAASVYAWVAS